MSLGEHLLPRGTRLNNLYEIEEHIADGGIGTVYRARDIESGDPVAIKVLLANFARDPVILDLFKREAKILRKLKHDALTQYFVFTKEPALGIYYLAMEFVSGPSLKTRLESGPLGPEAVYKLVKRLASALQAVHDREVIHRDLSPDNIILQNGDVDQAKIIDFGISRANTGGPTIIGDGFAGKVNYVSPEQVGIFDGNVTPRSDIYSLGLVIAESLTGAQIDMGGTQAQIVEKRRMVPSLDGVDNRFRPLLEAMLQPDPAQRAASMAEIADWTLGAPLTPQQSEDRTVILPSRLPPEQAALDTTPPPTNWGRRVLVILSLLGFVGLGAGAVYFLAGPTIPDQIDKPVLITEPRENAPEAPPRPDRAVPNPDSGPAGEDQPGGSGETIPDLPVQDPVISRPAEPDPSPEDENLTPERQQQEDPVEPITPEDRVRKFVAGYQTGECMYLQPVSITGDAAEIEGFASRTPPFIAFDSDFKQSQGFEAKIQVNLVSDAQCPAISFLRATPQGSGKTGLHLDMQRTVLPTGETMAGRISGYDPSTGSLGLLFVASNGEVTNLSPFLTTDNGGSGFAVPLTLQSGEDETGLVIAMVGPELAQSLATLRNEGAADYFANLLLDAPVLRATATTVKVIR